MNTRSIFPIVVLSLAAAGMLTAATAARNLADLSTDAQLGARVTDFPVVTVRPAPQDAAYFQAHRIVDLPRITVRPEPADLALFLADNTTRVVHLPVLPPQGSVLDGRMTVLSDALAAR